MGCTVAFVKLLAVVVCGVVAVTIFTLLSSTTYDVQMAHIDAVTTRHLFTEQQTTARHMFSEQQQTIRTLAEVNGATTRAAIAAQASQVWAHEVGDSVRTVAAWMGISVILAVALWQVSKTVRHWMAHRSLLLLFAAECLPDADPRGVRVELVGSRWMLRDYSTRQQWDIDVARAALAQRGLLTVDMD